MKEPRIETLNETKVVGKGTRMSLKQNTTAQLWSEFMPLISDIGDTLDASLWSVEVYPDLDFFNNFDPTREFEKWAAVPVTATASKPANMRDLLIPAGRYAVFNYKGKPSEAFEFYGHIYGTWIPNSKYSLDHRPHLAVMGSGYKGEHPESEEEIWIPVKEKLPM